MPDQIEGLTFYSTDEVAIIIGKSANTVRSLIQQGLIETKKVGQTHIITEQMLFDYLDDINLPKNIIEYRLGIKSPKTGKIINKPAIS